MIRTVESSCIICRKPYLKTTRARNGKTAVGTRPSYGVTCSKQCSKAYIRISSHLRQRIRKSERERIERLLKTI